ncbi:hypothetical protein V8E53_008763 [Lactarius tabidus]
MFTSIRRSGYLRVEPCSPTLRINPLFSGSFVRLPAVECQRGNEVVVSLERAQRGDHEHGLIRTAILASLTPPNNLAPQPAHVACSGRGGVQAREVSGRGMGSELGLGENAGAEPRWGVGDSGVDAPLRSESVEVGEQFSASASARWSPTQVALLRESGWMGDVGVTSYRPSSSTRAEPQVPRCAVRPRAHCTFAIALFGRCGEQCSRVHASGSGQAVDGLRKKGRSGSQECGKVAGACTVLSRQSRTIVRDAKWESGDKSTPTWYFIV